MLTYTAFDDKPAPARPTIEEKHEWSHGDEGQGKNCNRADKPIYTDKNKRPGVCRDWRCDNDEWKSGPYVTRDKSTKKILTRDGKKVE